MACSDTKAKARAKAVFADTAKARVSFATKALAKAEATTAFQHFVDLSTTAKVKAKTRASDEKEKAKASFDATTLVTTATVLRTKLTSTSWLSATMTTTRRTTLPTPARNFYLRLQRYNFQDWYLRRRITTRPRQNTAHNNDANGYGNHFSTTALRHQYDRPLCRRRLRLQTTPAFCNHLQWTTPVTSTTVCGDLRHCDCLCFLNFQHSHDQQTRQTQPSTVGHNLTQASTVHPVLRRASTNNFLLHNATTATTSLQRQFCHSIYHNLAAVAQQHHHSSTNNFRNVGFATTLIQAFVAHHATTIVATCTTYDG